MGVVTGLVLGCGHAAFAADIGVNDDTGKFAADGGTEFFTRVAALGLRQTVMTTRFLPADPTTIQDGPSLDRAVPEANTQGVRVSLAVYPFPPSELDGGRSTPEAFAAYVTLVAQRYPAVRQFIVLNEPNQPAFVRPQFDAAGKNVSAATAGRYLAAAYDALKAIDPAIKVIGIGLSPRGNDRPSAPSNVSTSPVRFLAALGSWYRSSGRTLPLMDGFSFHPYPNQATDPLDRGYVWPNAGFADVQRIKQALWDAFHGTPQPTTVSGLKLYLDEVGWQVDTSTHDGYEGVESVRVTTEVEQAAIYAQLVRSAACDPDIAEVNVFGFYDDVPRDRGFQAALNRVDGSPRPSATAVQAAIADTAGGCFAHPSVWRPAAGVVGVSKPLVTPVAGAVRVEVAALEGASAVVCVLPGRLGLAAVKAAMRSRTATSAGCVGATALPNRPGRARLVRPSPARPATVGIRVAAEADARRVSSFSTQIR
jgi:hypothetical protein